MGLAFWVAYAFIATLTTTILLGLVIRRRGLTAGCNGPEPLGSFVAGAIASTPGQGTYWRHPQHPIRLVEVLWVVRGNVFELDGTVCHVEHGAADFLPFLGSHAVMAVSWCSGWCCPSVLPGIFRCAELRTRFPGELEMAYIALSC